MEEGCDGTQLDSDQLFSLLPVPPAPPTHTKTRPRLCTPPNAGTALPLHPPTHTRAPPHLCTPPQPKPGTAPPLQPPPTCRHHRGVRRILMRAPLLRILCAGNTGPSTDREGDRPPRRPEATAHDPKDLNTGLGSAVIGAHRAFWVTVTLFLAHLTVPHARLAPPPPRH